MWGSCEEVGWSWSWSWDVGLELELGRRVGVDKCNSTLIV